MYLSNEGKHAAACRGNSSIPTNATHLHHHCFVCTNLAVAPLHTSIQSQTTDTSAWGARITTDDVAGSFCEPAAAKFRNYCPYSERGSGYRAIHTFISDLLSNQSTSLYALMYIYICSGVPSGGVWCVQTPDRNSEDIGGFLDRISKKNRRLDFLL